MSDPTMLQLPIKVATLHGGQIPLQGNSVLQGVRDL